MARRASRQLNDRKQATTSVPAEQGEVSYGDMLLHWVNQGYEVGSIVKDIQGGRDAQETFDDFSRKAKRAQEIVAELESTPGVPADRMENVRRMAKEPLRVHDLEKELAELKVSPRLKELKAEFMSLNMKGFDEDARRIQAKFNDPTKLEELDHDIKLLKRKIKERFFETEFAIQLEPVRGAGAPLETETIFIIHKDGTLLSVKSKQPKDQVDKKALSRMILDIRGRMDKGNVGTFQCDSSNVIMELGAHVCVAVAFKGEELPIMRRVLDKVVQIMERKNSDALNTWTGDRSRLMDMDRYPTALFQALDALDKKGD